MTINKKVVFSVLVLSFFLISCTKKTDCSDQVEVALLSNNNYAVHYELRKYVNELGVDLLKDIIRIDITSNSKKITRLPINDTTEIGVEVMVQEIIWREDTTLVFDVLYYQSTLSNEWESLFENIQPNSLNYFNIKLINNKTIFENDKPIYTIEDVVVFQK